MLVKVRTSRSDATSEGGYKIVKGADELLECIECVRRELNEQALREGLQSHTVLEKSKELDRLLNVYQSAKLRTGMGSSLKKL
jgi:hypothetical protein